MKTQRNYNHGRKLDGTLATDKDWEQWKEEFWEKEAKRLLEFDDNDIFYKTSTSLLDKQQFFA